MKRNTIILFFILFIIMPAHPHEVLDYFDNFYSNYIELKNIEYKDREIADLLFEISKNKIKTVESFLECSCSINEAKEAINTINDEFYELFENLNFETNFLQGCYLSSKQNNKIKKAHKKFIQNLEKKYINCYCKK